MIRATFRPTTDNPFDGIDVGRDSSPAFADIDNDGDLDLVVGEYEGELKYYENVGGATAPAYVLRSGDADPFEGIDVGDYSTPVLADVDGDGDLDLVVGAKDGTVSYFKNTGSLTSPDFEKKEGDSRRNEVRELR